MTEKWYTRPVFSVSDVAASLDYFCNKLGFSQSWKYEEHKQTLVTQVNKGDFELILAGNLDRVGMSRVFVSLEKEEMIHLRHAIASQEIPFQDVHWGYPSIQLADPDGNLLLFPVEESG